MQAKCPVPAILYHRASMQQVPPESHQGGRMCLHVRKAGAHPGVRHWQVGAAAVHMAEAGDGVQDEEDGEGEEEDLVRDVEVGEVVQDLHSMSAAERLPCCA